jgi:hypothetical protein
MLQVMRELVAAIRELAAAMSMLSLSSQCRCTGGCFGPIPPFGPDYPPYMPICRGPQGGDLGAGGGQR